MSSTTNSQKGPCRSEYFVDAFRSDLTFVWGATQFATEIEDLCHYRALSTCLKPGYKSVKDSRKLLFHYESEYSGEKGSYLDTIYKQLPISSALVRKYVRSVATAYKWAPKRTFGKDGVDNDAFTVIYDHFKVNRAFRRAHRYARLMNCVAMQPVVRSGVLRVNVLTPDLFRLEFSEQDKLTPIAIWYSTIFNKQAQLVRMDAKTIEVRDRLKPKRVLDSKPNTWGELQFTFLRLEESDESFMGGGDHELLEQRMESNDHRLKANTSVKYEGHSILIGTNLESAQDDEDEDGGIINLPPGSILLRNGVMGSGEENEDAPDLRPVVMQGQYGEIDALRLGREKGALRSYGMPNSNLSDEPGAPVSGAARKIERMELNDIKEEDIEQLEVAEKEFKRKVALAVNEARGIMIEGKLYAALPVTDTLSIEYVREPIVMEPADEYSLMTEQFNADLVPLTELVYEFGNLGSRPSEEDAVEYLRKNRAVRKRALVDSDDQPAAAVTGNALQESVGGSAQIASLQTLYSAGTMTREMAMANAMIVFKYNKEEAEALFPEMPEKKAPNSSNVPAQAGDQGGGDTFTPPAPAVS